MISLANPTYRIHDDPALGHAATEQDVARAAGDFNRPPRRLTPSEAADVLLNEYAHTALCREFRSRCEELVADLAPDLIQRAEQDQMTNAGYLGERLSKQLLDLACRMDLGRRVAAMQH